MRLATEPCDCGLLFAVLESVQGRVEDALRLPSPASDRVAVQPLVFNRIMDILPISGWQVIQEADDGLTVLLSGVRSGLADEAVVDQLTRALVEQNVRAPRITIQRVAAIPKTASGKAGAVAAMTPFKPKTRSTRKSPGAFC